MGIILNVKEYVAKKAHLIAEKTKKAVADASKLSFEQLEEVERQRQEYLSQKPKMDGNEVEAIVEKNLGAMAIEVYQDYLNKLGSIYEPCDLLPVKYKADNRIMYFDITKWVTDKEEKNLDKLVNVYHVLSEEDCNIALIYNRKQDGCRISLGIINTIEENSDPSVVQGLYKRVVEAIRGNFPGVDIKVNQGGIDEFGIGIPDILEPIAAQLEKKDKHDSVAVVTNLPSDKSNDFISQSMEKLLDGIIPDKEEEEYTIVLLAKPIQEQLEKQNRLCDLYSHLAPYATWSTNFMYTESTSTNSGANFGTNIGASAGFQRSLGHTKGTSTPERYNESELKNAQRKDGEEHKDIMLKNHLLGIGNQLLGWYMPVMKNQSETATNGVNAGANFGVSFSRSSNVSVQLGKNEGVVQTYTNYGVKHTLEILERQIKRIEQSSALGMWDFAAYVVSKDPTVANNVAHMYASLTQGAESFVSRTSISLWDGSRSEYSKDADTILKSVCLLQHPLFVLKKDLEKAWLMYPSLVTPTTSLSGLELAKALNFPRKSVTKFPVLESISFGRDVQSFNDDVNGEENATIQIGSIYHMRRKEEKNPVCLDVNSLASHVFITGSTGTGKTNVVCQLLKQLRECGKKFLVIEPAKGEYKEFFGGYDDVTVYGTNPNIAQLLQINPFSFPESIHVLEHIDRLVEILNACWPMYAAMPAVLKDAIEQIYIKSGWNLTTSKSLEGKIPTFLDLMEELPEVMSQSMYSDETKSDYSGALVTRVNSLTNGINRQIFCAGKETAEKELFEKNVIVDLSRIGSTETKSLIMGILVMKLQEYRLHLHEINAPLCHVTVLEEAHNILRKTSFVQTQESANLQGKSVEMISNAIAEMRSFGEGFFIADQAPNLLDESVIRNTNTKIVLRLPGTDDRKTVGTAISLTEQQINELAKLPRGVAAVYQNDWLQAVLCAFEKFSEDDRKPLNYSPVDIQPIIAKYIQIVFENSSEKLDRYEMDAMIGWIESQAVSMETKAIAIQAVKEGTIQEENKAILAYNLFDGKKVADILADNIENCEKGKQMAIDRISMLCDMPKADSSMRMIYQLIISAIATQSQDSELVKIYMENERRRIV